MDDLIVGSGGINYFPAEKTARLSWDIIHPDYQNRGLGKMLTQHRVGEITQNPGIEKIRVPASQLAYQFYKKVGFKLNTVEKNFWAEGIDLYDMSKST
jgi:ribosomal protein S18 acetylase RimI-like enzyme